MPTIEEQSTEQIQAYRASGKSELNRIIQKYRELANNYEILLNTLPEDLSQEADSALYNLLMHVKRF